MDSDHCICVQTKQSSEGGEGLLDFFVFAVQKFHSSYCVYGVLNLAVLGPDHLRDPVLEGPWGQRFPLVDRDLAAYCLVLSTR